MDMNEISNYLRSAKDALDIVKSTLGLLPRGPGADKVEERIATAETALKASEAELAKALGYQLCQCTFPPQIMLWQQSQQLQVCSRCGNTVDPARRATWGRGPRQTHAITD